MIFILDRENYLNEKNPLCKNVIFPIVKNFIK